MVRRFWMTTVVLVSVIATPIVNALPDFADLAQEQSPAVVKVNVVTKASRGQGPNGQQVPEMFRRFFEQPQPREGQSMGSGFIIESDGYIVTNHHVIDNAKEIEVVLNDRRHFDAELIGTDASSDIALLKIEAKNLPTTEWAKPKQLRVGEWVLAIGSPFGLDYSVSSGIVSAKGRSLTSPGNDNYVPFIQTDVAINPGNSGGPLFNLEGEVVGINSQIFTRSGGFMGLSFAIPTEVALNVIDQLKDKGYVARGWLGVAIQDVDKGLAESFGLKSAQGALVAEVMPGSPAEKAGLKNGDVVLEFDGEPIYESGDLPHVVGLRVPGETYKAVIQRDKKRKTLKIEVGELDREQQASNNASNTAPSKIGVQVQPLTPQQLANLDIEYGVGVTAVEPGGPAQKAGLAPGDVILSVGGQAATDINVIGEIFDSLEGGEPVAVRYMRRGSSRFTSMVPRIIE